MTYFFRLVAWVFLFLTLAAWGAEVVYSLQHGAYILLTPADILGISPNTAQGFLGDIVNAAFLQRPVWLLPAVISLILFLGVRRKRKKYIFRNE